MADAGGFRCVGDPARGFPDGDHAADFFAARDFADGAMAAFTFHAELAHAAEHGDPAACDRHAREGHEGCAHAVGICIVRVVEDADAADVFLRETARGELQRTQAGGAF